MTASLRHPVLPICPELRGQLSRPMCLHVDPPSSMAPKHHLGERLTRVPAYVCPFLTTSLHEELILQDLRKTNENKKLLTWIGR